MRAFPIRQVSHRLRNVLFCVIDKGDCAHFLSQRLLVCSAINGNDFVALDARDLHADVAKTAPGPDDGYVLTRLHFGRELGDSAGETETSTEQRGCDLALDAIGNVGDEVGVGDHVLLQSSPDAAARVLLLPAVIDFALFATRTFFARAPEPLHADSSAEKF